jgi:hypothetical protein
MLAIWVFGYIALVNEKLSGGMLLCMFVVTFIGYLYSATRILDPYLIRIEQLEEDKLELQAKIETMKAEAKKEAMKIETKKKSTKSKKND